MSRGLGHVQRSILALIASDDDGAWTTTEVCERVYRGVNRVEKKHRVAVCRALRRMRLPQPWQIRTLWRPGADYCMVNPCSLESEIRRLWLERPAWYAHYSVEDFESAWPSKVAKARESVAEAQRYRDADEIGKLDIDIAHTQRRMSALAALGVQKWVPPVAAQLKALTERRQALAQTLDKTTTRNGAHP